MSNRSTVLMRALTAVVTVVTLAPVTLNGQTNGGTPAATSTWTARTPWGDPDLQGVWNNTVATPLQRPSRFKDKPFLTDEELAQYTRERQGSRDDRDRRDQADGTVTDVGRAYNAVWFPVPEAPIKRTSLITDPPDGRIPPLLPEALKRAEIRAAAIGATGSTASPTGRPEGVVDGTEGGVDGRGGRADNPEDRDLGDRCIADALPKLPGGYNNHFQIVQTPGYVAIQIEMRSHVRIIPIDGRQHLTPLVRQWMGDSRGRFEGNTLVVETTNFSEKGNFNGSGANLHLVERFTRTDADTIEYEFTVTDPTTWARPWSGAFPLRNLRTMVGGVDGVSVPMMFEYACHEGNYGLTGILAGQRALDKAAATTTQTRAR